MKRRFCVFNFVLISLLVLLLLCMNNLRVKFIIVSGSQSICVGTKLSPGEGTKFSGENMQWAWKLQFKAWVLTKGRWHRVTVSPTARGMEPLTSLRRWSHTLCTTRTSTKVMSASIRRPCIGVISAEMLLMPRPFCAASGVIT